jgi:hypothetical protein
MARVGSAGDGPDTSGSSPAAKKPTRPGSQWATGKRKQQKGLTEKKGYARGAATGGMRGRATNG